MIVVDASVLATALIDDTDLGAGIRTRLAVEELVAPELIDIEVTSVVRRLAAAGRLVAQRADQALGDLVELPLQRAPHLPLVRRCWQLRENVSPYDAVHLALAEALEVPLLTGDARLAAAPGATCSIEVLTV